MNRRYLVAVASLAMLALVFGLVGTVAPPLAEETEPKPQQEYSSSSSASSTAHFQNPPSYDSGWVNIMDKAGQYVTLTHSLNTTDVVVDITGKQNLEPMGGILAWDRNYGGTGTEYGYSLIQTSDGGYALAGYSNSPGTAGGNDFWLVKTDPDGNKLWDKFYGGTDIDYGRSVVQTDDGGYAMLGYTASYGQAGYNFWLVKTDSAGVKQWDKPYGGNGSDIGYSIVKTFDGGYALAGITTSYDGVAGDFWLVKTDSSGNKQWNKTYGGPNDDYCYSMVQTSDGGYALAGVTSSFGAGGLDFWLVKTDASGNMQWSRTYGGTGTDWYSIVHTADEAYALAGFTDSYGAGGDFYLVKTDIENGLAWTGSTNGTITLYRGKTDLYWNYVRVRIWLIKEPTWIYGDINQDGIVDAKDLYILSQNYGKTFSLLSLTGIIAIAGIRTIKKRKQSKQPSYIS